VGRNEEKPTAVAHAARASGTLAFLAAWLQYLLLRATMPAVAKGSIAFSGALLLAGGICERVAPHVRRRFRHRSGPADKVTGGSANSRRGSDVRRAPGAASLLS
jgi:hypothetical protein